MLLNQTQKIGVALIISLMMVMVSLPAVAATIMVTTITDELNSDGDCSLREALEAVNTDTMVDACGAGDGDDSIGFASGLTGTITLNGTHLTISSNVTLDGPGIDQIIISGNNASRVFFLSGASTIVSISGLTIRDGYAEDGGGMYIDGATLTLTDSQLSHNTSTLDSFGWGGGGLSNVNGGTVIVDNCTFTNNEAFRGGGIHNGDAAESFCQLTVTNSLFQDNIVRLGGGIYNRSGSATLDTVTIRNNIANKPDSGGEWGHS